MGFRLPAEGSAAREMMGDMAHVVEVLNPANVHKLVDFRSGVQQAAETCRRMGAKRVNIIVIRANDDRVLLSVGPKGGWKEIWNFGNGRA